MNRLEIGPFGVHYAKIVDEKGKYVKWASNDEVEQHIFREINSLNRRGSSFDMSVPFSEKNEAKKLGAQWDPYKKVWYTKQDNPMLNDILTKYPNWISVRSVDLCERYANEPMVYTNEALEQFRAYQKSQGHNMDGYDDYVSEYELEREREKKKAEAARKKQERFMYGQDYFDH